MEYNQRFKEQIDVLEAYNGGVLFHNSPVATVGEVKVLVLDAKSADDMEKAQTSARGKYLDIAFLVRSDRRRYGELVLSLKNDYSKQQHNYPNTLTDMYRLMMAFDPTRATPVAGGRNEGMNFRNVVADSEDTGTRDTGRVSGAWRTLEC